MPSTYKTPGVYVEEVSTFPPSVAPVATAIPAFIGYTEIAIKNGEKITNVPTKVGSFVEFMQYFGGAPARGVVIRLDANNQHVKTETQSSLQQYYLYDSLRLFYDNGGGDCYIVSVGNYEATPAIGAAAPKSGILGGLKALEKFDEPTLIVCPDATLTGTNLYTFQQQALEQCASLQDRFMIGDLLQNDEEAPNQTFDDRVEGFRNSIGINNLKYGAMYAPWLKSNLSANLSFRDLLFHRDADTTAPTADTSKALLLSLTSAEEIRQLVYDMCLAVDTVDALNTELTPGGTLVATASNLAGELSLFMDEAQNVAASFTGTWASLATEFNALYEKLIAVIYSINNVYQTLPTLVSSVSKASSTSSAKFRLEDDINILIEDSVMEIFESLVTHHLENVGDLNLLDAAPSAEFSAVYEMLAYSMPAAYATVPADAATANIYDSLAAITALYAEINSGTFNSDVDTGTAADALNTIDAQLPADFVAAVTTKIQDEIDALTPADTKADLITAIGTTTLVDRIAAAYLTAQSGTTVADVVNNISNDIDTIVANTLASVDDSLATATLIAASMAQTDDVDTRKVSAMIAGAKNAISTLSNFYADVISAAESYENTFNESLKGSFGLYKTLLDRADSEIMVLPPSAAMAGIYTKVDNERGVWKAPANVSLSSVSGPYVNISAKEQEDLNVDVNAGKSINAIRAFTGKGILVWGARTLAGNDNEWRYVPVRRFFNFAEESIKKATEQFVFEPNDANTWVRVRAMIENFLILQWRAGALAGAKPEQAFFVKIGLGETMTALDILEGRMIVEIGMAVVRPAEFIILRFSHKMQES